MYSNGPHSRQYHGDGVTSHGVTVGMGSNAAVKWKRDEQCSLLTLLTACWTANFVVLDWRWTKIFFKIFMSLYIMLSVDVH